MLILKEITMAEEQVEVRHPQNPNRKVSMSVKDFDPAKHEAWSEKDEEQLKIREQMAENMRSPMPGPPMQMPAGMANPNALADQPNAAVIEAPGSTAAQMIQRARGDVPIYMQGTRQDRAEMETRRANAAQGAPAVSPKTTEEDWELRRREYSRDQSIFKPDLERTQAVAKEHVDHEKAREEEQLKAEEAQVKAGERAQELASDKKNPKG